MDRTHFFSYVLPQNQPCCGAITPIHKQFTGGVIHHVAEGGFQIKAFLWAWGAVINLLMQDELMLDVIDYSVWRCEDFQKSWAQLSVSIRYYSFQQPISGVCAQDFYVLLQPTKTCNKIHQSDEKLNFLALATLFFFFFWSNIIKADTIVHKSAVKSFHPLVIFY